ncbi:unnamed protein product [Enterobius vermicularis]|uniref:Uncharacterized protein n=1 Tax=Enterobius vermicularis TaxID=51028 RepID=A0A0N4VP09_ENTVE|nr:unnamed protein product [Enterobius vermicularis]
MFGRRCGVMAATVPPRISSPSPPPPPPPVPPQLTASETTATVAATAPDVPAAKTAVCLLMNEKGRWQGEVKEWVEGQVEIVG